jgi:hypothetical protein
MPLCRSGPRYQRARGNAGLWSKCGCEVIPSACRLKTSRMTRLLLLRWLLEIFGPSTKARARHNFRRLGLTNSIRALFNLEEVYLESLILPITPFS